MDRFSGDALDREVVDLLVCAQRTQAAAPVATATGRLSLREVQEKADSVREMWVRQRMTGAELERIRSAEAVRVEVGAPVRIDGWGGPPIRGRVSRIEPAGFTKVSVLGIDEQRVVNGALP